MADILTLLRYFIVNKMDITQKNDQIIFGKYSWRKNLMTCYMKYGSNKTSSKEYYTLESLLFLMKNVDLQHSTYIKHCVLNKIQAVSRPDRKELLAYLQGEIETSHSIDKNVPFETPTQINISNENEDAFQVPELKKLYDRIAARINGVKFEDKTDTKKSLAEFLSVDKINKIKAKRLANKRFTTSSNDNSFLQSGKVPGATPKHTKEIFKRERHHRTRNSILRSSGKVFDKNILAILNGIKARENGKTLSQIAQSLGQPRYIPSMNTKASSTYNRYDQEKFIPQTDTEGFKIDTMGTYHGMSIKSVTETVSKQNEMPVIKQPMKIIAQPKLRSTTPIIILPGSLISLISMYNVKDILENLSYVSTEDKKKAGVPRVNDIMIQRRKKDDTIVPYKVVEYPMRLAPEDWDRVVAVFVTGRTWQFKGWPFKGPVEICSKICAFNIRFVEHTIDKNVERWAVTVLNISESKRHLDAAVFMTFWQKVERYILQRKPYLRS